MSRRLRVVVALVCAALAALACLLCVNSVRADAERERNETLRRYGGEMVTLVVAVRALEVGETVTTSDVEVRDWISSLAPDGAILTVDEVVGRKVSAPVASNAPLCELNFRAASETLEVPSGQVAVSVPITDKLGMNASVAVGSRVVAYRVMENTAELIGGLATVLSAPAAAGTSFSQGTVTIAVNAQYVPAVLAASTAGDLRLVVPADDVQEFAGAQAGNKDVEPAASNDQKNVSASSAAPAASSSSAASSSASQPAKKEGE